MCVCGLAWDRPDRYFGNMVVEQLNTIAVGIMAQHSIPVIDLYTHVTSFCGQVYKVRGGPRRWRYAMDGWCMCPRCWDSTRDSLCDASAT